MIFNNSKGLNCKIVCWGADGDGDGWGGDGDGWGGWGGDGDGWGGWSSLSNTDLGYDVALDTSSLSNSWSSLSNTDLGYDVALDTSSLSNIGLAAALADLDSAKTAASDQKSWYDYAAKAGLTTLSATGSLGLAAGAAVIGGLFGAAQNGMFSGQEAEQMAATGTDMVQDTTTGQFAKASDFGLSGMEGSGEGGAGNIYAVETDSSGKITNYLGGMNYSNITSGSNPFNTGSPGADTQASYEQKALDYLIGADRVPRQMSEGALKGLGGVYGLEGGTGSQEEMIQRAMSSPLYGAIMGGREAGEEAILRNASATGGLRSGNVQHNMYDYNTQLENKALLESYNQQMRGLEGLAQLDTGLAPSIAVTSMGLGQTLGQGQTAAAQMAVDKKQSDINNLMGLGSLGLELYGMFSDRRLKENIKYLYQNNGHNIYSWNWNIVAQKMGLKGASVGCMAEEVHEKCPEAVSMNNGFMFIDYSKVPLRRAT